MNPTLRYLIFTLTIIMLATNVGALTFRIKATPESAPGEIMLGSQFSIDMYMNNNDVVDADPANGYRLGISMPFAFLSDDGSLGNITHVDVGGLGPTGNIDVLNGFDGFFNMIWIISPWSYDGTLPDSLNFTGIGMTGWPYDLGELLYLQFHFQAVEPGRFCVDSIQGRTSTFDWLFDDPSPDFGGPYCWEIIDTMPSIPEIFCPSSPIDTFVCLSQQICVEVPVINANSVGSNLGSWANDTLCFFADSAGSYNIEITAYNADSSITDICQFVVNVDFNSAPTVYAGADTTVMQCTLAEICLPLAISDINNNISSINVSQGSYDSLSGNLCFTPADTGIHCIVIEAIDQCGESSDDTVCVTVNSVASALINCPAGPIDVQLCGPEQVCVPLDVSPASAIVSATIGTYSNGLLCFMADTAGSYVIDVTATSECGEDNCLLVVNVSIGLPPTISCPIDTAIQLCAADQICLPIGISPASANVTTSVGIYNDGSLCFNADSAGLYEIQIFAETNCGVDTCQFIVDVELNSPPVVNAGADTTILQCTPAEICLPVTISDIDNNIQSIIVSQGSYSDGNICFMPTDTGTYCIIIEAVDICGEIAIDTICISVETAIVELICPSQVDTFLCASGQICVPLVVSPASSEVSVSYGTFGEGNLCFDADTAGSYVIEAVASGVCGADSCTITINVGINTPPVVLAPSDMTLFQCTATEICFAVSISDINNNLQSVSLSYGTYDSAGNVCFTPDTTGVYCIEITATDSCGAFGSDTVCVTVDMNSPPLVDAGADSLLFVCQITEICQPVVISDPDNNLQSIVTSHGTYDSTSGNLCFTPDSGGTYCVEIRAIDQCGATMSDTVCFEVIVNSPPIVYAGADTSVFQCLPTEVCLPVAVSDPDNNLGSVTVSDGSYGGGLLCFTPPDSGVYCIGIRAVDLCGLETFDTVCIIVGTMAPPAITCTGSIDTVINLDLFSEVCFEIDIVGEQTTVTVSPNGSYSNGSLCVPISQTDTFAVSVVALNSCGQDSCELTIGIINYGSVAVDTANLYYSMYDTSTTLPDSQTIGLSTTGEPGLLEWELTIINDGGWLATDGISGSSPDDVKAFIADTALLMEPGTYTSLLRFRDVMFASEAYVSISLFIESGVDVGDQFVEPGTSFAVPITLLTDEPLSGFSIPLVFHTEQPEGISLDSIVVDSALGDEFSITGVQIDDTTMIVYRPIQEPPVPDTLGAVEVANAYFSTAEDVGSEVIIIDTTTVDYGRAEFSYMFYDTTGDSTIPNFDPGTIVIGSPAAMAGNIVYYDLAKTLNDVSMQLTSDTNTFSTFSIDGFYEFYDIPFGLYRITPERLFDDPGVSIADVIKIRRHLAQLEIFDSPYKFLSADVNTSAHVSIADIVIIRRYLARLQDLPSGNWTFADLNYVINDSNWFSAPDFISTSFLGLNLIDKSFVGMRNGDVNNSYNPGTIPAGPAKHAPGVEGFVSLVDGGSATDLIPIEIEIGRIEQLAGLELHLTFDSRVLHLRQIKSDFLKNFVSNQIGGDFHLVWDDPGRTIWADNSTKLVTLIFEPLPGFDKPTEIRVDRVEMVNALGEPYQLTTAGIRIAPREPGDMSPDNENSLLPDHFYLESNYPNPFNPSTEIRFGLPVGSDVSLEIFNILGQRVATPVERYLGAGTHSTRWDAGDLSSGIYLYRLKAGTFVATKKMILLK